MNRLLVVLSVGGFLFSGYLSAVKFLSNTCAFNECPYFLGYPACYFGFAMFSTLLVVSVVNLLNKTKSKLPLLVILIVSILGILFAGNFVVKEVVRSKSFVDFISNPLGFPTCVYGLVFYILIFVISLKQLIQNK